MGLDGGRRGFVENAIEDIIAAGVHPGEEWMIGGRCGGFEKLVEIPIGNRTGDLGFVQLERIDGLFPLTRDRHDDERFAE